MVIKLENQQLTTGQLKNGKIQKNILSATELFTIDLAKAWLNGHETFEIKTSGSTGKPQTIQLRRDILECSARTSMQRLDPDGIFHNTLLCINPKYIGGMMVVIRALIHDLDLTVIEPDANPSAGMKGHFDLVSMVPLQVQHLLDKQPEKWTMYKTILVGGAPLPQRYQMQLQKNQETTCYHTYGMTETASHIALKNLTTGEKAFSTLGDIQIEQDLRGCIKISGTVTNNQWIQTNDVVDILNENQFIWKGRADFVINSGGIKVHPEAMEAKLSNQISSPFFIGGIPDDQLGEKVVLLIEGNENPSGYDFSSFHKYEKPKIVIHLPQFIYTDSGKINRLKTLEQIK